jgi:cell division protein FtsW
MPRHAVYDRWLFAIAALLILGGLLMVGSASSYVALAEGRPPSAYLVRHGSFILVGFIALLATLSLPYRELATRRVLLSSLVAVTFVALLVVLAMPPVGGARRWLFLGALRAQPSEAAKLVAIVFCAWLLASRPKQVNERAVLVPMLLVPGSFCLLIMIEPDLGTAVVLAAVAGMMLFVAGLCWRYLAALGAAALVFLTASIVFWPYRLQRALAFLYPEQDPYGSAYQLNQSLLALGKGGLTGAGFGLSQQKAFYIPAAHTDFVFAVLGEELGLFGTSLLLVAFLLLLWRGTRAALRAPDRFGAYLAFGLTGCLVLQAFVNMAVSAGLLPTKGIPLPFLSYGGSSLVSSMAGLGLLLNVSQHSTPARTW